MKAQQVSSTLEPLSYFSDVKMPRSTRKGKRLATLSFGIYIFTGAEHTSLPLGPTNGGLVNQFIHSWGHCQPGSTSGSSSVNATVAAASV